MLTKYNSNLALLQQEYEQADVRPKHIELVTDKEVEEFLRKRDTFWTIVFFAILAISILIPAVIGE